MPVQSRTSALTTRIYLRKEAMAHGSVTVIKVLIARPADAEPYAVQVHAAIDAWNKAHADTFDVRLVASDWKSVSTSYEPGTTVQSRLDKLIVDPSRIVIALFSRKLGAGHTTQEIARAVKARDKQILVYTDDQEQEPDLKNYLDALRADDALVSQFRKEQGAALTVFVGLNDAVQRLHGQTPIAAHGGHDSEAYSIQATLNGLVDGDRVVVVGRTCLGWLGPLASRRWIQDAITAGVRVTFVVQDLYDMLADARFTDLRQDLTKAEEGYGELKRQIGEAASAAGLLNLLYSPVSIRHSRTLVYRRDVLAWIRYDLTMQKGPKPFVVISDRTLGASIVNETHEIERSALTPTELAQIRTARLSEETFRMDVADAQAKYSFSSETRGNAPQRLVRQAARVHLSVVNNTPRPAPLSVQILLSLHCNTHCAMCTYYVGHRRDTAQPLTASQFKQLVDDLVRMGTRAVTFSGGEPLQLAGVSQLLTHCRTNGIKVGILTSGVLGGSKRNEVLDVVASSCAWLQVSIDSFSKNAYVGIRNSDQQASSFAKLETCKVFLRDLQRRQAKSVEVCFTIQRMNIEELFAIEELRDRIDDVVPAGIPIRFKFATGRGNFLSTIDQLRQLKFKWATGGLNFGTRITNVEFVLAKLSSSLGAIAAGYPMKNEVSTLGGSPCHIMQHSMFIDCYGDVYPCCFLFNDNVATWEHREAFRIGTWRPPEQRIPHDADRIELSDIWNSDGLESKRRTSLSQLPVEACGRCTRHMQQNAFLEEVGQALKRVKPDATLERALQVFEDPNDRRFRPVWL
jgi:organic radical activating enzyme